MVCKRFKCAVMTAFLLLLGTVTSAKAVTFAEYAYRQVRIGNISTVHNYLRQGYSIDAVDGRGNSALCMAAKNRDYVTYRRLIQLGAKTNLDCMNKVGADTRGIRKNQNVQLKPNFAKEKTTSAMLGSGIDDTTLYAAGGLLAAGGIAALALSSGGGHSGGSEPTSCPQGQRLVDGQCVPIVCPEGTVLVGDVCVPVSHCESGERWDGEKCVPLDCPDGTHLVGDTCVVTDTCPTGFVLNEGVCEPIECPEGKMLVGDACVTIRDCPIGQIKVDGECVDIVCPAGTRLDGNYCVTDESASRTHTGDDDFYGVASDNEDVFNLYSSPSYPDDEKSIVFQNKGNGDVYGLYGYRGEVFNSYVVGVSNDGQYQNKKPVGSGTIIIKDEGSGSVYGMRSRISDITQYKETINASGWNYGTAYADINIEHIGGGATYGISGDVRAYNVFIANGGNGYGDITIHGDGDIYGIYGFDAATNVVSIGGGNVGIGNINLFSTGNGNVYGMAISKADLPDVSGRGTADWFAINGYIEDGNIVDATINIHNIGNGTAYGMYGGQQLHNTIPRRGQINGTINIASLGGGNSYGMYIPEADTAAVITNTSNASAQATINITNLGDGIATGIRGSEGNKINSSGTININNMGNGTAVGIYGERGAEISHHGTINIYRDSYTDTTDGTIYTPQSEIGGTAYGIYAETGASVINSGTISISGAANGQGIYLEEGAVLENSGNVYFNGVDDSITENGEALNIYGDRASRASVSLGSFGGEVVLNSGGKFFADNLSGRLAVSQDVVSEGFEDSYSLVSALEANSVDGLSLSSKSVMFTPAVRANSAGGYDVVMSRRPFYSLVNDEITAQFLEDNYRLGNGRELFSSLKTASSMSSFSSENAKWLGQDIIPGFYGENMSVYHHLSRQFDDNLFNEPNKKYIGGYKYLNISRSREGVLEGNDGDAHTAYGMVKNKADNGVTYGLGATISQLKSDYDNGSSRKSNIFGLWAPIGYQFNQGGKWFSKLYGGYEDGSYDRVMPLRTYSSDIKAYQYGMSNEFRQALALGKGFSFTPAVELNLLGRYQEKIDEGGADYSLHTKSHNSLSLEGGLGAYLTKEMLFNEDNKLSLQIGGIYYVEFLEPDEGVMARMQGMGGAYKLSHKTDDTRAVFSLKVDYTYKDLTFYGMIEQEAQDYKAWSIDAGLTYSF